MSFSRRELESESESSAIFDALPLPAFVVDQDLVIHSYNIAGAELLGPDPKLSLYRRSGEALHCLQSEAKGCGLGESCADCVIRNSVRAALEGRGTQRQAHRVELHLQGKITPIDLLVTAARLPGTASPRALLVLEDISTWKRAETAVRESEEKYRRLFEAESDANLLVDGQTFRILDANPAARRLYGYTVEEFLRLTPQDLSHEPDRTSQVIVEKATEVPFRWQRKKDGTVFPVEITLSHFELQGREVHVAVVRDMTERHAAETALRASEEQFRAVVENGPIGIFVQTEAQFAYVNPAAASLLGAVKPEDLIGKPILERIHPDDRVKVAVRIRLVNTQRRPMPLAEQKYVRLDGTTFAAEVAAVPFTYQGKQGALVFFRDITERKNLEQQLRQAQKMEAIGQLAGGVAHDFNNILAATMIQVGLLRANPRLDATTQDSLKELEAHAQRAASLTRQLLLFGRRSLMQIQPVDLNELVSQLLKMLRRLLGEQIEVRFEAKAELPMVEADAGMLDQVVTNLCVNARDAMSGGGRLMISTGVGDLGEGDIAAHADRRVGQFVTLSVSDTGCGMSEETRKRIFEPFFTTKEVGRGTGLGLATVYGIVRQHQGWIEVRSEPGKGSTFRIFLPARSTAVRPEVGSSGSGPLPRGDETILLVEDEAAVRNTTARWLQLFGYRVIVAANGREAAALWPAHRHEIALLLTDMIMPEGLTGLDLVRRFRSDQPDLKVIITSGYSAEMVSRGIPSEVGIIYLPKPCEAKRLLVTVRNCLDQRQIE